MWVQWYLLWRILESNWYRWSKLIPLFWVLSFSCIMVDLGFCWDSFCAQVRLLLKFVPGFSPYIIPFGVVIIGYWILWFFPHSPWTRVSYFLWKGLEHISSVNFTLLMTIWAIFFLCFDGHGLLFKCGIVLPEYGLDHWITPCYYEQVKT